MSDGFGFGLDLVFHSFHPESLCNEVMVSSTPSAGSKLYLPDERSSDEMMSRRDRSIFGGSTARDIQW